MVAEEDARNLRQETNDLPKDDLESEVDVDGDEAEDETEDERILMDHMEIDKTGEVEGQMRESSHDQGAEDADVAEVHAGSVMSGMVMQVEEGVFVWKLGEMVEC